MAEHLNGSSGVGLRPKVVEAEYVEALGVLVVPAARHRSWQPSSPNGQATSTSPPHPTSVNLSAKNLGVGRKKIARPVRNFPKGENWILNRPACCLPKKSGPSTYLHATVECIELSSMVDFSEGIIAENLCSSPEEQGLS